MDEQATGTSEAGVEAVGRFVEQFALILTEAGFPRMAARVFVGLLVTEDGRRTAGELSSGLRISLAAVSGAVQYLAQVGLIVREREPGQRSDHYRVRHDLWYESFAKRDAQLLRWEAELQRGIEALGLDSVAGQRLDETRQFFGFLRRELPALMHKWREQRALQNGD